MATTTELLTRAQSLLDSVEAEDRDLTDDEQGQYDTLLKQIERSQKIDHITRGIAAGTVSTEAGSPQVVPAQHTVRTDTTPGGLLRDEARQTIERANTAGHLPAHAAEKAERLVTSGSENDQGIAARWATTAGDPAYLNAFAKLLADPTRGHLLWTGEEADAYRRAEAVNVMLRTAMSTTAANGGSMIPLTLDPAIMITNDGSINPLRQVARVVQTVTNSWSGVTTSGASSEWKSEGSEAADGSPTLGNPVVPVFLGDSFVPYSFEVGMDALNFLGELQKVLVDSADNLMATAYTTGNGTTAPQGFVTGLAGTASEINTTGSEAIVATDAYALQNALPPRFQANAKWLANIAVINTFAQFETTNGALKFPEVRDDRLLRKPLHELSNMDGSINAAATANNYVLAYGDWKRAFLIVDRIGSQLEIIPNLVGSNRRPTGQRGALLWFRTGSEVIVPEAARMLDVPTTA